MTLEELKSYLGKFDGYAICKNGVTLENRCSSLEHCIMTAVCEIEENFFSQCQNSKIKIEIWSVENITVKSVAPSADYIIDSMFENFQHEDFLQNVDEKQKKLLSFLIENAIETWLGTEKIDFDYYTGIRKKELSYEDLKKIEEGLRKEIVV